MTRRFYDVRWLDRTNGTTIASISLTARSRAEAIAAADKQGTQMGLPTASRYIYDGQTFETVHHKP